MSHELRTPLNAIIGFSEVLLERLFGDLNDRQDGVPRGHPRPAGTCSTLLNDILDLSKVEAGRWTWSPAPSGRRGALVEHCALADARARRRARRHAPELDVDPRTPVG